ncbi:MAG: SRPBCC domain-containing protein, partial [Candidatus Aminicenantaceae bacterium]
ASGERLQVTMKLEGRKPMVFKPRVKAFKPRQEFRWLGHLILPGVFDGEHAFVLEPMAENRVRFIQKEGFRGILVPSILKGIQAKTQAGFEAMNQALKERAEK